MKTANFMYWVTIVLSFFCSFTGNWQMSMGFLGIAAIFQCTELIIKEIRNGKCKEGSDNSSSAVVETSS